MLPTAAPPPKGLPKQAGASLNDGMCPWCHVNGRLLHDINKHRIPPELSLEEVCAATASESMTKRTGTVLHLDRVIKKALGANVERTLCCAIQDGLWPQMMSHP